MPKSPSNELLLIKYNTLSDRKRHFDSLFWQIPSLSLGGQAFLLSIALNNDTSPTARILSATLGVFVAFVSLASLSRIRLYEFTATTLLVELEKQIFGSAFSDTSGDEWSNARDLVTKNQAFSKTQKRKLSHRLFSLLHPIRSYELWVITLILFILVGLSIIVSSLLGVNIFS